MKTLVLYSTVLGHFYEQTEAMQKAVNEARRECGEDLWKRGYTGSDPHGATSIAKHHFKAAQVEPITPQGRLKLVGYVLNRDAAGNDYPKLRVGILADDGSKLLLSLDLKSDVAQRLLVKLAHCEQGQHIKVSAWPTPVERGGRTYINHAVSVKYVEGKEVPVDADFSKSVKNLCDGVEATLVAAGINDKRVISAAKATKRVDVYKELLIKLQNAFPMGVAA